MERVATLREQSSVLRTLAHSFDIQAIRDQLLDLATRCDMLANSLEENPEIVDIQPSPSTRAAR
jgi:hypothetical protein